MSIPFFYYFIYWLKYSILSIATGTVVGLLLWLPFGIVGLFVGIIAGQIIVIEKFIGKKRGEFEFSFLNYQRKMDMGKAITDQFGCLSNCLQFFSEVGEISWSKGEKYQAMINNNHELKDPVRFLLMYKIGMLSKKDRNYQKAILYFSMCLESTPYDLPSAYVLAQCYEREGLGEKAIESYRKASYGARNISKELKQYIDEQIKRIKLKGPSKKTATPGLMHTGVK